MFFLLSCYLMMVSMMTFISSMIFLFLNKKILITWNMILITSFKINFTLFMDWMNFMFLAVVMFISSMVLIFSMEYMKSELFMKRFMLLIVVFFTSMMFMIFSPNMFSILIGWDGLGLSSYCLIIYYQNKKSYMSGMTTILMNRIGDISILLMISMLINHNSLNFMFLTKINNFMMFMVILICITKSAQIPFSSWLPMAMAAPTPVSSLVHSSTLVTAGIFLMIRFHYLMNLTSMTILLYISIFTMMMASTSALHEFDLKKIIALSTLSQLSLMFMCLSLSLTNLSFFHLLSHAMFKSLLFLCSGIMIHNYLNNQDIRLISLMDMNLPMTNMIFNTASLTLSGMPFLSGFFSKDLIIEMFNIHMLNSPIYNIMYLCMMMTLLYSVRLTFYLSIKPMKNMFFLTSKINNLMNNSIYTLFFMSLFYGSMMNWVMFNSINMIILPLDIKMMIFKLLSLTMILFILTIKTKLKNMNLFLFFNMLWFFNNNFKKMKMNMFSNSNKMILIKDMNWLEMISSKKFLFTIKKLFLMKLNKNFNMSKMIILIMNFLIIMLFMI